MGNPGEGQARHPIPIGRRRGAALRASATLPRVSPADSPDGLLGRPLPDLTLPDARGTDYRLRQFVARRPLVLFFYVLNGSPG
jgi:hypothetical protein